MITIRSPIHAKRWYRTIGPLSLVVACALFSDAAVDLAACINRVAKRMSTAHLDSLEAACPVRGHRTVTAVLMPPTPFASATDSEVASALHQLGLPTDAIVYSGPDAPSVGHLVGFGPVYVYDGGYSDNRKYSTTSSLLQTVRITTLMAKTGNRFVVKLRRTEAGSIDIVGLR